MADGAGVAVDLPVIAALISLVTEEVNSVVADTARLLGLGLEVAKAVSLVPAGREDIEGDLTSDREATIKISTALADVQEKSTYVRPR